MNASNVNISAGVYFSDAVTPFDLGVEAVGEVVAVSDDVQHHAVGGYREYFALDASLAILVPDANPEAMTIVVSALTASVGLEEVGRMRSGETVLITAAAGGVGHYAVQLAKMAGNHVIGTCSSDEKAALLHELGCDRVINYRTENLDAVLKQEYPDGINLVFESVGRVTFDVCVNNMAVRGRLGVCGFVSEYVEGTEQITAPRIYEKLLWTSASIHGFLFSHYIECVPQHVSKLMELFYAGKLHAVVDPTEFMGVESVVDAVEHLHSGRNCGKVVVRF